MKSRKTNEPQRDLFLQELELMLDPHQPLYQLARKMPWVKIEEAFAD